jgi:uncharacterized protein (DUF1015 family)
VVDAAPFRALRYRPEVAGDLASTSAPAYEEFDPLSYARHRSASPYTVLELLAPPSQHGYEHAAATFRRWQRTGVLATDPEPAFYCHEQRERVAPGQPDRIQRGLLAAVRVPRPGSGGAVVAHEDVDPARVKQRLVRLAAVPAELTPVFTIAPVLPSGVHDLLDAVLQRETATVLTDEAGVEHRVVATSDHDEVAALRADLHGLRVVIADGHHRYAAAVARHARGEPHSARTLLLIVDARTDGPRVLPVHRLLGELPANWEDRLSSAFAAVPAPTSITGLLTAIGREPAGSLGLRMPGAGFLLRPTDPVRLRAGLPPGTSPTWRGLDAALVEHEVLPRLGIERRKVAYRAGLEGADEVDRGEAAALLVLRAPDIRTVLALALHGERMPAKTTSFHPKPRMGLIMRPLGI